MKTIGWMLTRMIISRFLLILFGVSVFVLSLDLITYINDVLALRGGSPTAVAEYFLFRAPGILSTFLPISVLLALLLTLTELSYRTEMVAIWASGFSPFRVMLMLVPIGLLLGGIHFLIADRAIPGAAPVLREWGIGDYSEKKLQLGEHDPIWMRAGTDILRADSADDKASRLEDVIIFRRDPDGLLREQIFANSAVLAGGRWTLENVIVYYRDNVAPSRLDRMIYSGAMKPAAAGARSGDPEEMSMGDLSYFIENAGFGIRPAWVYQTWWHKRLSLAVTSLLMIGLCIPLAVRFRRGGGIGVLFAVGVAAGFTYFIIDGISLTMGELGFVTPWLAAWMPVIAFSAVAVAIGLRTEAV
jgi:lipopolysaccharide export system permease protein